MVPRPLRHSPLAAAQQLSQVRCSRHSQLRPPLRSRCLPKVQAAGVGYATPPRVSSIRGCRSASPCSAAACAPRHPLLLRASETSPTERLAPDLADTSQDPMAVRHGKFSGTHEQILPHAIGDRTAAVSPVRKNRRGKLGSRLRASKQAAGAENQMSPLLRDRLHPPGNSIPPGTPPTFANSEAPGRCRTATVLGSVMSGSARSPLT